jgi:hypothetical protein
LSELYTTEKDQHVRATRILSAVIALAVTDAAVKPLKTDDSTKNRITDRAFDAIEFLFADTAVCDLYLDQLDIDPTAFRLRLLEYVYTPTRTLDATKGDLSNAQRRNLRLNYQLYGAMDEQEKRAARRRYRAELRSARNVLSITQMRIGDYEDRDGII